MWFNSGAALRNPVLSNATQKDAQQEIMVWLRQACDRKGGEEKEGSCSQAQGCGIYRGQRDHSIVTYFCLQFSIS